MPQQIDPVPAMTTNPGAPPVAPYKAIFASVTTSISPISSGVSVSRMRSRSSLRRAPASPICAATRSPRRIFAEAQALSIASRIDAAAPAIPTRSGLDGPARPSPITCWLASIMTASVLVPPPSTPTTEFCVCKRLAGERSAVRRSVVTVGGRSD